MSIEKSKKLYDEILKTASEELKINIMSANPAVINQYNKISNIPFGTSGSESNPIVLGHKIPLSYIETNSVLGCDADCNIISFSGVNPEGDISFQYDRVITTTIATGISQYSAGNSFGGTDTIGFNSTGVSPGSCSGFLPYNISDSVSIDNSLVSFVTGIGLEIPFTGGIGNVESSYFERLNSTQFIIAPQATGQPLLSQDNDFYIYTAGIASYSGISHPSQTGLREVVGGSSSWSSSGNNHILCRYSSDLSSIFKYDISGTNWTTIDPFTPSTSITRIIKLEKHDGLYLIVGTGIDEHVIYNSFTDISHSITNVSSFGSQIIPENIALVPDFQIASCSFSEIDSDDIVFHNDAYHVFAIDYDYSGNSVYPLKLISPTGSTLIANGDFTLSGTVASGTTYLNSYLNYRSDIINVADKLIISLSSTGNNNSEMFIWDNTIVNTGSFYSYQKKARLVKLKNDQILWCSASNTGTSTVIDPYQIQEYSFPIPLTGNIGIASSCYAEYRTLMLDVSGTNAYIINDLDRTYESFSFTGSLSMGKYHDIFVFDQLNDTIDQSRNFYLMPNEIYSSVFPKSHLVALSTTTTSYTGVSFTGSFEIDETVVSFDPTQTTTGLVEIGRFIVETNAEDEFVGTYNFAIHTGYADSDIFNLTFSNNSGIIYVNSGISLDYESQNFYFGYISGVDLYVNRGIVTDSFTLNVLPIDENPTGIVFDPVQSGGYNANDIVDIDKLVGTFTVYDPDDGIQNNVIGVSGADAGIFNVNFNNNTREGSIYIKSGTVFDINTKDLYQLTLYAGQSGSDFSVSGDWTLYLTDEPPISISITPSSTGLLETYIPPFTGLKLADFTVQDSDTNRDNFVHIIGSDASYFSVEYDFANGTGQLRLEPDVAFDYETKTTITATLAAGNINGIYSTTSNYIINVENVDFELSGITATPSISYLAEDVNTSTGNIKLCDLRWTDNDLHLNPGAEMVIFDLRYTGTNFGSALDKFEIVDNSTKYPKIYLKQGAQLDYEEQSRYDIEIHGRPDFNTDQYGTIITLVLTDVNDPPNITFSPTGILLQETTPSNAGSFKVCDIIVSDEELSTVNFNLTGSDSSYFTMQINDDIQDSFSSEIVGSIYFNSGTSLNVDLKNIYTATVLATDSSGLIGSGNFVIEVVDEPFCEYKIDLISLNNNVCGDGNQGTIIINLAYTGEDANSCNIDKPLSVSWRNLPSGATSSFGGRNVNNLSNGDYTGFVYGGEIPLDQISYSITSLSDLEFLQSIKTQYACENTGTLKITWRGGLPPYVASYGFSSNFIPSGSGFTTTLNIVQDTINQQPKVRDARGCEVFGGYPISFDFPQDSFVQYDSQSPPIIHDDVLQSFRLHASNNDGPYTVDIYHTTTGEKGSLFKSFDMFDTSIIDSIDKSSQTYYYDFQNVLYPDTYVFNFTNLSGCSILSAPLTAANISPMTLELNIEHDLPQDLGFYNISQPILDTLFIPYKMILNNANLLSYISNATEKTDIKLEINGEVYTRKLLNGSINCQDYAILNIKFLGIKDTDWYYTLNFFQGFDLTNTDIDILNANIYLVLPDGEKIRIVSELNNNINTIKLLKGSIITGTSNIAQYVNDREIGLFYYDFDIGNYISMDVKALVSDFTMLTNKYLPGTVSRVGFLEHPNVSDNMRSDALAAISFDCNTAQQDILNNRKFLLALNDFSKYTNTYAKTQNHYIHNGSIRSSIDGGYGEYNIQYYYYNTKTKCLNILKYNNEILTGNTAEPIGYGTYILKIRDVYGNKLKSVNNLSYDFMYEQALDYILNTLDTTGEEMGFEYGDILVNIIDTSKGSIPDDGGLPGFTPDQPDPVPDPPVVTPVTTNTYAVSPNTTYKNSITIQTSPVKLAFIVTGPNGYSKKFYDRSILIQMPPGVYNIQGDPTDLRNKYLYQQTRSISVNSSTNTFVSLKFISYQDSIQIDDETCFIN